MIELTSCEVRHALNCCVVNQSCVNCPLYQGPDSGPAAYVEDMTCTDILLTAALKVIENLTNDLADAQNRAAEWEATCEAHERKIFELYEDIDRRARNEKL